MSMTKPKKPPKDLITVRCRVCGRPYGQVSFHEWQRAVQSLYTAWSAQRVGAGRTRIM